MSRLVAAVLICGALMAAPPSLGCTPPAPGEASGLPDSGYVQEVVDGDTVRLKGGLQVRLVGIQAPKLSLGRSGFVDWPLGEESKRALEALTLHKTVSLFPGETPIDRNQRLLAQVHVVSDKTKENVWVQGEMIGDGLARVYTWKDNRFCAGALYQRERPAREARRGIWALDYYAIRSDDAIAAGDIDTFQLVEGKVRAVAQKNGRVYLNFGADWKTDFTASVSPDDRKLFDAAHFDFAALEGRQVRIRGWLESYNGPMMALTHPEQLEVLRP